MDQSVLPIALSRRAAIVAAVAAAGWIALGLDSLARPDVYTYRDAVILAPWLLTGIALTMLQRIEGSRSGRLGSYGLAVVVVAIVVGAVGTEYVVLDAEWLGALALASIPVYVAGMAVVGAATIRAGVVRRRAGFAIALSEPLTVLAGLALSPITPLADHGAYSGAVVNGTCLLVVAWECWRIGREALDDAPATRAALSGQPA